MNRSPDEFETPNAFETQAGTYYPLVGAARAWTPYLDHDDDLDGGGHGDDRYNR